MLQALALALAAALLLPLPSSGIIAAAASGGGGGGDDDDFFSRCPASSCGHGDVDVRFPFRLTSSPASCGLPGMELSCSSQEGGAAATTLHHPVLGLCKVTAIDYRSALLNVAPIEQPWIQCPLQKIINVTASNLSTSAYISRSYVNYYSAYSVYSGTLVGCSAEFTPNKDESYTNDDDGDGGGSSFYAGPVSCYSSIASQFVYLVDSNEPMSVLPRDCTVMEPGEIPVPMPLPWDGGYRRLNFSQQAGWVIGSAETTLGWSIHDISKACIECEKKGCHCGFGSGKKTAVCQTLQGSSRVKVIAASSSAAALVVLLSMAAAALYISLKTKTDEEVRLKIEMFLKAYAGTSRPTRYTFSEVKKITKRFKVKLGQGGFGSVYRGELADGVPVAVKMLLDSSGDGDDFINEVATIGRIHHANVVRLLGFCSEGARRGLVYQFMPNDSLERYIFGLRSDSSRTPPRMLEIASGIARGIEYLHQGCNQRILHFDIKPRNILLDHGFVPKISDFGLAKLCARDQSVVTMTAARGTMGYIAPELYSRSFGTVSYKSDVYSFGMLVLEMVSGRRNSDPLTTESHHGGGGGGEVYIPEWVYERVVVGGAALDPAREMTREEQETERKLALVALWCIQWNPRNRPSMARVVNMLTSSLPSLTMPPKPFVASPAGHPMPPPI